MDVAGDAVFVKGIARFTESCRDFTTMWPEIVEDFQQIELEQFATEGARSGNPWAPLSASYERWKMKNFPSSTTLVLTGEMRMAMTNGLMVDAEPMRLEMRPSLDKTIYHQRGTAHMPKRKVVDLTDSDKARWVRTIQRYLVDRATEAGLR